MEESAEKDPQRQGKKGGASGIVSFADRPRPLPLSTKRSDFFVFFALNFIFFLSVTYFFAAFSVRMVRGAPQPLKNVENIVPE